MTPPTVSDTAAISARLAFAGAVIAGICVAGGAFGAHALRGLVAPERLVTFETGVRYGLVHGIALVALAALAAAHPAIAGAARRVGWLWVAGVVVFTGSLTLLVLLDVPVFGAITPIGGVALIAGWALLAVAAWRARR